MTWATLSLWPLLSAIFFSKLRLPIALLATILGGYLLLPTQTAFDLPLLPALNKSSIPALTAFLLVYVFSREQPYRVSDVPLWSVRPGWLPQNRIALVLFVMLFVGEIGTHLTNGDPLFYGSRVLPALRPHDAISALVGLFLTFLPFLLARKVLYSLEGQRLLLLALAISGFAYSFLALFEVRMSPQLNQMVYGFFAHSWDQHYRSGGWRPIVFLNHGLQLGIFFSVSVLLSAALIRISAPPWRYAWIAITVWLFATLVLAKVLGALMITLVLLGVLLMPRRAQIMFIFGVTVCILVYPAVRATALLPYEQILSVVESDRAASFKVRLDSEQLLLDKANERPLFGWGGWSRSRVFDNEGYDIAITDGAWVIWLGLGGWIKYISILGLLSLGILSLFWQKTKPDRVTVALAVALTANLVDLIPNAGITSVTWLLAGALCGRLEQGAEERSAATTTAVGTAPSNRELVYSRTHDKPINRSQTASEAPKRHALPYRRDLKR